MDTSIFTNFFKYNKDVYCVLSSTGQILTANDTFCQQFGFSKEVQATANNFFTMLSPKQMATVKKNLVHLVSKNKKIESQFRKTNGTPFILKWGLTLDAKTKNFYISGEIVENEGNDKNRFYTNIIENSWESIILSDTSEKIIFANRSANKTFGVKNNALVGKTMEVLYCNSQANKREEMLNALTELGGWSGEILTRKIDGRVFYGLITASMIYGNNAQPMGIALSVRDISERKAMERQLLVAKEEAEQKSRLLAKQKTVIEKVNESMLASISCAQRIQSAMLPEMESIHQSLPNTFVLFQPRDIVSGDFYWCVSEKNKTFIAAVDCTGHGVPGALMSMVGKSLLDSIVLEKKIHEANLILDELHIGIRNTLKQDESDNKDGMDMALCIIDHANHSVQYAGAKNELVLIKNGELEVIKADRLSIGGRLRKGQQESFSAKTINIDSATTFYIFSDGFKDQFGGAKNIKLGSKRFKQILTDVHTLPINQQKENLKHILTNWKGDYSQIDDVLVIGFKLNKLHNMKFNLLEELEAVTEQFSEIATDEMKETVGELMTFLAESEIVEKGPKVGESVEDFRLPNIYKKAQVGDKIKDFKLLSHLGEEVTLSSLLEKGPVVINFYKGGWCPYCNVELKALQRAIPEFEERGSQLVAISLESPDTTLSTIELNELEFLVLSDTDGAVATSFGILYDVPESYDNMMLGMGTDIKERQESDIAQLVIPASYVIDQDFIVKFAFLDEDFSKRADIEEIIGTLEEIKAQKA